MPKSSQALQVLPPAATQALRALGENLAIARVRRRESQRAWAKRLGVSVPTLIRLERGDPGVGAGIYATALWLMGRVGALPGLAAPVMIAARSNPTSARPSSAAQSGRQPLPKPGLGRKKAEK